MNKKLVEASCDLCGGSFSTLHKAAKAQGLDLASCDREHRGLHALVQNGLVGPGGAMTFVASAAALRREILEQEGILAAMEARGAKGPAVEERRARLERLREELAEREAWLAELPEVAKTDPFQAVSRGYESLEKFRASGELDLIRRSAAEVAALEASWREVVKQREVLRGEIEAASRRVRFALSRALREAFGRAIGRVATLTSDPVYVSAPELLPIEELKNCWRDAAQLLEAIQAIAPELVAPSSDALLDVIPAPLLARVRQAWGLAPARARATA